jgi:hypothetical protein
MNSLKTIVVLPRLLQQTQGRVSRKSPAYHIDDRADGFESGGHPLMNSLPKASDHFLRICRAVEVAISCRLRSSALIQGNTVIALVDMSLGVYTTAGSRQIDARGQTAFSRQNLDELEQRGLMPQAPTVVATTSVRVESNKHCRHCFVFTAACPRCMKLHAAASTSSTANMHLHTPFLYQNKLNDAGCTIDARTCSRGMDEVRNGHQREMKALIQDKKRLTRQAQIDHKQRSRQQKTTTSILNMKKSLLALQKQQRFEEARELHAQIVRLEGDAAASQKVDHDQKHGRTLQRQRTEHASQVHKVHQRAMNQQSLMQLRSST